MASYNTFSQSFSSGGDEPQSLTISGDRMETSRPTGEQSNSAAANASGLVTVGGVQMPAEQAQRYGLLPDGFVQPGESSQQALNRHEVAAAARQGQPTETAHQPVNHNPLETLRAERANAMLNELGVGDTSELQARNEAAMVDQDSIDGEGADVSPARLSEDATQLLDTLDQNFGQGEIISVLNDIVASGDIDPNAVTEIASTHGLEPEQLTQNIGVVVDGLSDAYHEYASSYGFDSEQIIEWAREQMPEEYQQGMKDVFHTRDPRAMDRVIDAYAENLDKIDPAAILDAELGGGMQATYDSARGIVVLHHPSFGQVPWQQAVRLKLIQVGPQRG